MPNVLGIDHVAVAVNDLDEATNHWVSCLGLSLGDREIIESQGVEVQMLFAGDTRIELICPLSESSPVAKYLEKRGPGIHHLALEVEDVDSSIADVLSCGEQMVHTSRQSGAHGSSIAFVHPRSASGVLLEWVQNEKQSD